MTILRRESAPALAAGVAGTLLVMVVTVAAPVVGQEPDFAPLGVEQSDSPIGVGRYRVYFSPHLREDTYLIDTKTGRIWKQVQSSNGEAVWEIMRRID